MSKSKLIYVGLALIVLGLTVSPKLDVQAPALAQDNYEIKQVIDGDTIEITRYGKPEQVRLIGLDTPETVDPRKPVQCFGKEASDNSKKLLSGQKVRIEFDQKVGERDRYGRLLAYIWLNSELVNLELIRGGYAHEYTYRSQSYKYQDQFKEAEGLAKQAQVGFWSPQTCGGVTK